MAVDQEKLWNPENALRGSLKAILRSPNFGTVVGLVAFEIAYFLAFRFTTSFGPASYRPLWLPGSVLLCALLKTRTERWWLFILAMVLARVLGQQDTDLPLWVPAAYLVIDIAKGLGAAIALRRFIRNPLRLDTLHDLGVFALFAALLVPALMAFAGATVRAALGDEFWSVWARWFVSDALAQLVVTPPILYWVFAAPWNLKNFDTNRVIEAALTAAGLVLTGYWCFAAGSSTSFVEPRFYVPIPLMFWAALRFGIAGASGAVAITSAWIIVCAFQRDGPFSSMSVDEAGLALQNLLFWRSVPLYFIAALIEQRDAAERAVKDSEQRFRTMADTAPALLCMTGPDKLATFVNRGWLKFTGRTLEQQLGSGWLEGVHPDDLAHCLESWNSAFEARRPVEVEYRMRRYDGEYRWIVDKGNPRFGPNGEFLGYVGSALDITERKRSEEMGRALAHVQRLAVMGELTAAVAHELRQPSAAIMSNAEAALKLLQSGAAPADEIREIVADIKSANMRANEVLGRIQDFLRKREARMEPVDLNAVVSDVLPLVAGEARKRRIEIRTELGEGLPQVSANRTHLQQVLINLVLNAMDSMSETPEGKRRITMQTKVNDHGHIEVAVVDNGSGIPAANLPHLFDSFFTTRAEGMGLGLSIARSIVESHNGRIWANNNEAGGATFHFTVQT